AAVAELAGNSIDWGPAVTADGLEVYFGSSRGMTGNYDIFVAKRASRADPFGAPTLVSELSNPGGLSRELPGWTTPDGCRIYFSSSNSSVDQDLFYADKP